MTSNLFPGDLVRITSEPYYRNVKFDYNDRSKEFNVGDIAEVIKGPDEDGDYKLKNTETGETGWVNGEHLERLPRTQFVVLSLDEAINRIEELERRLDALEERDGR